MKKLIFLALFTFSAFASSQEQSKLKAHYEMMKKIFEQAETPKESEMYQWLGAYTAECSPTKEENYFWVLNKKAWEDHLDATYFPIILIGVGVYNPFYGPTKKGPIYAASQIIDFYRVIGKARDQYGWKNGQFVNLQGEAALFRDLRNGLGTLQSLVSVPPPSVWNKSGPIKSWEETRRSKDYFNNGRFSYLSSGIKFPGKGGRRLLGLQGSPLKSKWFNSSFITYRTDELYNENTHPRAFYSTKITDDGLIITQLIDERKSPTQSRFCISKKKFVSSEQVRRLGVYRSTKYKRRTKYFPDFSYRKFQNFLKRIGWPGEIENRRR